MACQQCGFVGDFSQQAVGRIVIIFEAAPTHGHERLAKEVQHEPAGGCANSSSRLKGDMDLPLHHAASVPSLHQYLFWYDVCALDHVWRDT
jgi:hypothetical protein